MPMLDLLGSFLQKKSRVTERLDRALRFQQGVRKIVALQQLVRQSPPGGLKPGKGQSKYADRCAHRLFAVSAILNIDSLTAWPLR